MRGSRRDGGPPAGGRRPHPPAGAVPDTEPEGGRWLALLALLLALLLPVRSPVAATVPDVRLDVAEGRARIRFTGGTPFRIVLEREGERIVLRFRGVDPPDPAAVVARLPAHLAGGTRVGDAWRLLPRRGVRAEAHCRARVCILTLVRIPLADVGLRVGRQGRGIRLVFEGPDAAAARAEERDGTLVLHLPAPAAAGVASRLARIPVLGTVRVADRRVELASASGWRPRLLRLPPDRLVVDVVPAEDGVLSAKTPAAGTGTGAVEEDGPPAAPDGGGPAGGARGDGSGHGPDRETTTTGKAGDAASARPEDRDAGGDGASPAVQGAPVPHGTTRASTATDGRSAFPATGAGSRGAGASPEPARAGAPGPAGAGTVATARGTGDAAAAGDERRAEGARLPPQARPDATAADASGGGMRGDDGEARAVEVRPGTAGLGREEAAAGIAMGTVETGPADLTVAVDEAGALRLVWTAPTGLAALQRGRRVLLLFDRAPGRVEADRAALGRLFRGRARDFRIDRLDRATLLWFTLREAEPVRIEGGGRVWILRLGATPDPPRPPDLRPQEGALTVAAGRAHRRFADPVAGDALDALTCPRARIALAAPRRFVDLAFLPSLVCVVWRPLRDDLTMAPVAGGWRIARPGGLRIAAALPPRDPAGVRTATGKPDGGASARHGVAPPPSARSGGTGHDTGPAVPAAAHDPPPSAPPAGASGGDAAAGVRTDEPSPVTTATDALPPARSGPVAAPDPPGAPEGTGPRVPDRGSPDDGTTVHALAADGVAPPPSPAGRPETAVRADGSGGKAHRSADGTPGRSREAMAGPAAAAERSGDAPHAAAREDAGTGAPKAEPPLALPPWTTVFGLGELAGLADGERLRLERAVRRDMVTRPAGARTAQRMELARLLLAEALGPEAAVQLALLPEEARGARRARALALAAAALSGRLDRAERLLAAEDLAELPEVALFRVVVATARRRWDEAAAALERAHRTLKRYPEPLQRRLGPALIAAALQAGDPDRAFVWLDRLARMALSRREAEGLRFLEALAVARDGAEKEALAILGELERTAGWRVALQAAFARIRLARDLGRLSDREALARLGAQRGLWRGHPWESAMLRTLGDLAAAAGEVEEALAAWRELLARHPDAPEARDLPEVMRRFARQVVDPETPPRLAPAEALAFLRGHPELFTRDPDTLDVFFRLAEALAPERPASALALLETHFARLTDSVRRARWLVRRAELLAELGRDDRARALLDELPATAPAGVRERARVLRLRLAARAGDPEALAALAEADPDPEMRRLWLDRALEDGDPTTIVRAVAPWLEEGAAMPTDEGDLALLFRAVRRLRAAGEEETARRLWTRLRAGATTEAWRRRLALLETPPPLPATVDELIATVRAEMDGDRATVGILRESLSVPGPDPPPGGRAEGGPPPGV